MAVNLPEIKIDYVEVFGQNDIWNYSYTGTTAEEIKDLGNLYYDTYTSTWYRDFIVESNNTKTKIPIAMDVVENEDHSKTFTPRSIVRQRTLEEMIDKNARANGLEYDKRGLTAVKNAILNLIESDSDLVPNSVRDAYYNRPHEGISNEDKTNFYSFVYDEFGQLIDVKLPEFLDASSLINNADADFYDFLWEMDHVVFGEDISHKYTEEVITRPIGENVLTPYAKENLNNALASLVQDEKITASSFSADELYTFVNDAILNSNDADVLDMLSHNCFRIMTRTFGGKTLYIDFIGYNVLDNVGVVSNNDSGQTIGVTLNGGSYVLFYIDSTHFNKEDTGSVPYNLSVDLYNYPTGNFVSNNGFTTGPHAWSITDTIGFSADRKPYDLTPNYTYPSTPPHRPNVSDKPKDDDPEEKPQDWWEIGVPQPDPIIDSPPIPGVPPIIPRDTPSEDTKPVPPTTNMLKGMCNVYKPTDAQIGALNQFLWTDTAIDDLTQLWKNNPLEGVIAYHQLYFNAETFGQKFIKLGTVVVSTAGNVDTVKERFQTLECGFMEISRYFNDKRDYDTKISIYLPFIGIRELDTNEVMDSVLYVTYNIDVVTGDCTANLSVDRKTSSGARLNDRKHIAMFEGNCSSPIPLCSADRSRLYSSVLSGALGVVGSLGNPLALTTGLAGSIGNIATQHQINIQKSGNIGGNRGAMAFKKPYLIIEKPIPVDATERGKLLGRPCNYTVKLGQVTGYTECRAVHVETISNATDWERDQIANMLKAGVLL